MQSQKHFTHRFHHRFRQNTGYAEKYTYDAAGNMLQKQITGTDGKRVQLTMQYNAGNQLTETTTGNGRLTYSYDPNGSMTAKTLTGTYGTLTDVYTYNKLDQLSEYTGYDGYRQKYTYDANGMRLSKETYGNSNRSTLEELLRGDIAGLPEVILPGTQEDNSTDEYEWATEGYLYDITQEYYQVIAKTEKTANEEKTTAYAYGLERIAAYGKDQKTTYVYDGRGSVAKTVSTLKAGDTKEQNFIYTAFGEQMGMQKVSGFGYNAEAYDAATGKINLRARQYEPAMGRFEQKDVFIGYIDIPITKNEYIYCFNNPIMKIDPKGRYPYNIELEYKPNNDLLASPNESIYSNIYDEENTTYVMLFDWSEVKQLTTKEVYAINREEGEKQGKTGKHISGEGKLYDIESGETINIVWNNIPDMYHTDWSPKNDDDVNIMKKILQPDYDVNDKRWKDARTWSWEAREAILYLSDGSLVAVGVHFRPHGTTVGGSNVKSLKSASQENDESGKKPLGGHMCMYFGDSRNDLQKKANPEFKYNAAAHNAKKRADTITGQEIVSHIVAGIENVRTSIIRPYNAITDKLQMKK